MVKQIMCQKFLFFFLNVMAYEDNAELDGILLPK